MFASFDQILFFAQNEMYHRDLLVAAIAAALGLNIIYAAATNNTWIFDLRSVSMLERQFGRQPARMILASLGTMLILVGIYLTVSSSVRRSDHTTNESGPPTANVPQASTLFFGAGH